MNRGDWGDTKSCGLRKVLSQPGWGCSPVSPPLSSYSFCQMWKCAPAPPVTPVSQNLNTKYITNRQDIHKKLSFSIVSVWVPMSPSISAKIFQFPHNLPPWAVFCWLLSIERSFSEAVVHVVVVWIIHIHCWTRPTSKVAFRSSLFPGSSMRNSLLWGWRGGGGDWLRDKEMLLLEYAIVCDYCATIHNAKKTWWCQMKAIEPTNSEIWIAQIWKSVWLLYRGTFW